jgi:hypothetical protein
MRVRGPALSAPRADVDLAPRTALALCALAVAIGLGVRMLGLRSDFWLDEVWSWWSVRRLGSARGVFTALHHSNNNHLNSLWIYAVGDAAPWVYRLPSLLAGSASVALGAWLGWRRGRLEAALSAILLAGSFALVHFSSEARGYATAVAFALGAQCALESALARWRWTSAALFGACIALGFLSHLVFLFYWAGAAAQSSWQLRGLPWRRLAARLAALHAAPLVILAALYRVDLRFMVVGGGDPNDIPLLVAQSVGYALGLPAERALAWPYGGLALALVGAGLWLRARERDASWIAFGISLCGPVLAFALLRPEVIALRYFVIGIALGLLLCADLAAHAWRRGGAARALAALAVLAFLSGNAHDLRAFAALGRGGYAAALRTMAENTAGSRIEVGSDHDFRNAMVLRFYARELPPDRQLVYVPQDRWPPGGPEWLIRHAAQRPAQPLAQLRAAGSRYRLFAEFDHASISGFYWALYRREDAGGAAR